MKDELLTTTARCPRCQSQIGIVAGLAEDVLLECPMCGGEFTRATAIECRLPVARVAERAVATPALSSWQLSEPLTLDVYALDPPESEPLEIEALRPETYKAIGDVIDVAAAHPLAATLVDESSLADSLPDDDDRRFEDLLSQFDGFEHEPQDDGAHHHGSSFDLSPSTKVRRRHPSPTRAILGIVAGGVAGLLIAAYALVWLRGPDVDIFRMSGWLPAAMLPRSVNLANESAAPDGGAQPAPRDAAQAGAAAGADGSARGASDRRVASESGKVKVDRSVRSAAAMTLVDGDEPRRSTPADRASDDVGGAADGRSDAASPRANADLFAAPRRTLTPKIWPTTPVVQSVMEPHFFSLEELAEAVADAKDAGRQFIAGDLAVNSSVRNMGQAYIQLCAVAERYAMIDPAAYGATLFTQQALAKGLLAAPVSSADRRQDLGVISCRWLQHSRRSNQGVLFVGRVRELRVQGRWTECVMAIEAGDEPAEVVTLMDRVRVSTGREAAVAGVLVSDPEASIADYQGTASQVVIAAYVFDPATTPAPNLYRVHMGLKVK